MILTSNNKTAAEASLAELVSCMTVIDVFVVRSDILHMHGHYTVADPVADMPSRRRQLADSEVKSPTTIGLVNQPTTKSNYRILNYGNLPISFGEWPTVVGELTSLTAT